MSFDKTDRKPTFIKAYKNNYCNVSEACRKVDIARETYYNWRKEDEDFDEKCKEAEKNRIDLAESKLFENVKRRNQRAIEFALKNLKPDIYTDKQQIDQKVDSNIKIVWELDGEETEITQKSDESMDRQE